MKLTNSQMLTRQRQLRMTSTCKIAGKLGYAVAKNLCTLETALVPYFKRVELSNEETKALTEVIPEMSTENLTWADVLVKIKALPEESRLPLQIISNKISDRDLLLDEESEVEIHMANPEACEAYPLDVIAPLGWMLS